MSNSAAKSPSDSPSQLEVCFQLFLESDRICAVQRKGLMKRVALTEEKEFWIQEWNEKTKTWVPVEAVRQSPNCPLFVKALLSLYAESNGLEQLNGNAPTLDQFHSLSKGLRKKKLAEWMKVLLRPGEKYQQIFYPTTGKKANLRFLTGVNGSIVLFPGKNKVSLEALAGDLDARSEAAHPARLPLKSSHAPQIKSNFDAANPDSTSLSLGARFPMPAEMDDLVRQYGTHGSHVILVYGAPGSGRHSLVEGFCEQLSRRKVRILRIKIETLDWDRTKDGAKESLSQQLGLPSGVPDAELLEDIGSVSTLVVVENLPDPQIEAAHCLLAGQIQRLHENIKIIVVGINAQDFETWRLVEVKPLDPERSLEFLVWEASRMGEHDAKAFAEEWKDHILPVCAGNFERIKRAAWHIKAGKPLDGLAQWLDEGAGPEKKEVTSQARDILGLLHLVPDGLRVDTLAAILAIDMHKIYPLSAFIKGGHRRWWLQAHFHACVDKWLDNAERERLWKLLVREALRLDERVGLCWNDLSKLKILDDDSERKAILTIIHYCTKKGDFRSAAKIARGARFYCYVRGQWEDELLTHWLLAAKKSGDKALALEAYTFLTNIAAKQNCVDVAVERLAHASKLAGHLKAKKQLERTQNVKLLHAQALVEFIKKNVKGAIALEKQALKENVYRGAVVDEHDKSAITRWLAKFCLCSDNVNEAHDLIDEELEYSDSMGFVRPHAAALMMRAEAFSMSMIFSQNAAIRTRDAAQAALDFMELKELRDRRLIAEVRLLRAESLNLLGQDDRARQDAVFARDEFRRLHNESKSEQAQKLLDRLFLGKPPP